MIEKTITLQAPQGFHARPASEFVKKANEAESEVFIGYKGREVNAKSIMGILSLGAAQGAEVILKVDGSDEAEMAPVLEKMIAEME